MDKRKLYGTIIGIVAFIMLALGVTYAYFNWTSDSGDNTNVNLTVSKGLENSIVYSQGTSILETDDKNLEYSNDYTGGISATIEFWKKPASTKKIYGKIYLEILKLLSASNDTNVNITKTNTIKWAITTYDVNNSNEVLLNEGTFYGKEISDKWAITHDMELKTVQTFYKIYLWFDYSAIDISLPVAGELLSTKISASATDDVNTFDSPMFETLLANYSGAGWNRGANGLYATNPYTADDGTTKYHEYRYVGSNVDNYVWFNNDMYRIIGIFDNYSHGVKAENGYGEYLVKLISANFLTANSWGVYSNNNETGEYSGEANDWTGNTTGNLASLNILLNEFFFKNSNTSYGFCNNWTYFAGYSKFRTFDCSDINGYSIDGSNQNYIEEVTWGLNGMEDTERSKESYYICERAMLQIGYPNRPLFCKSATGGSSTYKSKIGLMYASDYLYASGYVPSNDISILASDSIYGNGNWMYKGFEWTITPIGGSSTHVTYVNHRGVISDNGGHIGLGVRPVFYLKSSVKITGGDGSFINPYILSL